MSAERRAVNVERRIENRRISPAVGELAIQENARLMTVNAELVAAAVEYLAAQDDTVQADDDIAAMLRYSAAFDALRAALAKSAA